MNLKSYKEFIAEGETTVVKAEPDTSYGHDNDKETEKKVQKYMDQMDEDCPRCGEPPEVCKCEGDDHWSTQNYHRVPKGEEKKSDLQQKFTEK
tara:strand:+ start:236 stop:514 length:279 start_codon:yes stop_codon:yes gene_type:complete